MGSSIEAAGAIRSESADSIEAQAKIARKDAEYTDASYTASGLILVHP
jgi:hypothetical protein